MSQKIYEQMPKTNQIYFNPDKVNYMLRQTLHSELTKLQLTMFMSRSLIVLLQGLICCFIHVLSIYQTRQSINTMTLS